MCGNLALLASRSGYFFWYEIQISHDIIFLRVSFDIPTRSEFLSYDLIPLLMPRNRGSVEARLDAFSRSLLPPSNPDEHHPKFSSLWHAFLPGSGNLAWRSRQIAGISPDMFEIQDNLSKIDLKSHYLPPKSAPDGSGVRTGTPKTASFPLLFAPEIPSRPFFALERSSSWNFSSFLPLDHWRVIVGLIPRRKTSQIDRRLHSIFSKNRKKI